MPPIAITIEPIRSSRCGSSDPRASRSRGSPPHEQHADVCAKTRRRVVLAPPLSGTQAWYAKKSPQARGAAWAAMPTTNLRWMRGESARRPVPADARPAASVRETPATLRMIAAAEAAEAGDAADDEPMRHPYALRTGSSLAHDERYARPERHTRSVTNV